MSKRANLSSQSKAWLTAALDPFHDNQLDLEGLPDQRSSASVVQLHVQNYTLTAPTSAGAGNWDAKVSYSGFDAAQGAIPGLVEILSGTYGHPYDPAALSTGVPFGALNIRAVAAGAVIPVAKMLAGETATALGSFVSSGDRGRLIAVGFEVNNTTAEIYKQGSMTVGMLPDAADDSNTVVYAAPGTAHQAIAVQADYSAKYCAARADLAAVPTSCTWPAANGVYAIPRMTKLITDPSAPATAKRTVLGHDSTNTNYSSIEPNGSTTVNNVPAAKSFVTATLNGVCPSGFSPVEAYFTGLSPQTTLTVTFRTLVEYFPGASSNLLPMATPSPPYDPTVLKMYSNLVRNAPYAVMVKDNASGDYFRVILRLIQNLAPVVAGFSGAYAPAILLAGKAAGAVNGVIDRRGQKVDKKGAGARAIPSRR